MNPALQPSDFWKSKLDAYLHDPPEKVLDLAWHKQRAQNYQVGLPLADAEFARDCDHTAAAADRLPWPQWQYLESAFDGQINHFKHPLGKSVFKIQPFRDTDLAHNKAWSNRPNILENDPRALFFAYWRLWRWWAADTDYRLAFLPADTRLPDHTIWVHNSIVSALQACATGSGPSARCSPAFLLFHVGPVQEYIAQARRTLDLWSGSYLLSYLIGNALKHIALSYGPDCVIFPNLCGQPIFDLLLREDIWTKVRVAENKVLWECFGYESDYGRRRLLTPSLPNRFLAVLPSDHAASVAKDCERVIRETYAQIADEVWTWAATKLSTAGCWTDQHKKRFDLQTGRFLDISWQVVHWPPKPDDALALTQLLPSHAQYNPRSGLETILAIAKKMPQDHRDVRNFECEVFPPGTISPNGHDISGWKDRSKLKPDAKLDNPGAAWSALYQLAQWQLTAVRQTRAWKAWNTGGWQSGREFNKDNLNGKEEAILLVGSNDEDAQALNAAAGIDNLFKPGELLGATTLVKRLWPTAWLQPKHGFKQADWSMPDTRSIALGKPFATDESAPHTEDERYFAVLAFDGDEMGKWVSGLHDQMPTLGDQLSDYLDPADGKRKGAKVYFENNMPTLLARKRPLTPSFHLQFSEMLSNFANFCVRRVIEAHDGRLVYAGGDDVLALLPAHQAIPCAVALRAAFRGEPSVLTKLQGAWRFKTGNWEKVNLRLFSFEQPGFIKLHKDAPSAEGEPKEFFAIVPGPAAECSVGIAIAHFQHPLQDVVREAQLAKERAKSALRRGAVSLTLIKRSGETVHWGCKWDGSGLTAYSKMIDAVHNDVLSNRFPHRLIELVEQYRTERSLALTGTEPFPEFKSVLHDVLKKEIALAIDRQRGRHHVTSKATEVSAAITGYLAGLDLKTTRDIDNVIDDLVGLCKTVAFISRNLPGEQVSKPVELSVPAQPKSLQTEMAR